MSDKSETFALAVLVSAVVAYIVVVLSLIGLAVWVIIKLLQHFGVI